MVYFQSKTMHMVIYHSREQTREINPFISNMWNMEDHIMNICYDPKHSTGFSGPKNYIKSFINRFTITQFLNNQNAYSLLKKYLKIPKV